MARHRRPQRGIQRQPPPAGAGCIQGSPSVRGLILQDQARAEEPGARLHQAPEQRRGHGKRWIRDDVIRASREPEVAGVGFHDHDSLSESVSEVLGSLRVGLDGDDASAGVYKWIRERAETRTDVEN